jgi:hypothetical protein
VDFAALFHIIQSWGPSAVSSCLVVVVLYLIKQVTKNGEEDKKRDQVFQDRLGSEVKKLRDDVYKVLEEHGRKLSYIEMEYIKRETFHRDMAGWKDDINRLSDRGSAQHTELMKYIAELWRGGGNR